MPRFIQNWLSKLIVENAGKRKKLHIQECPVCNVNETFIYDDNVEGEACVHCKTRMIYLSECTDNTTGCRTSV